MERIKIVNIDVVYNIDEKYNDFLNETEYLKSLKDFLYKRTIKAEINYRLPSITPIKRASLHRIPKTNNWKVFKHEEKKLIEYFTFECIKGKDFIKKFTEGINKQEYPEDDDPGAFLSMDGNTPQ